MVYDMVFNMESARKITANIPAALLKEAQKVTGSGITETLIEGLRLLRRQLAYNVFQGLKGKLKLEIDLDEARERNHC